MDYMVFMDGNPIRSFSGKDYDYIVRWCNHFCKGETRIAPLREISLPKASKMRFNVNKGAYKYNPFTV